jgi:hypothetical protein
MRGDRGHKNDPTMLVLEEWKSWLVNTFILMRPDMKEVSYPCAVFGAAVIFMSTLPNRRYNHCEHVIVM